MEVIEMVFKTDMRRVEPVCVVNGGDISPGFSRRKCFARKSTTLPVETLRPRSVNEEGKVSSAGVARVSSFAGGRWMNFPVSEGETTSSEATICSLKGSPALPLLVDIKMAFGFVPPRTP